MADCSWVLFEVSSGRGADVAFSGGAIESTVVVTEGLGIRVSAFPNRVDDPDIVVSPISLSLIVGAVLVPALALAVVTGVVTGVATAVAAVSLVRRCTITGLGREPELGTGEGRAVVGELGLLKPYTKTGVLVDWCKTSPGVTGDTGGSDGGGGGPRAAVAGMARS